MQFGVCGDPSMAAVAARASCDYAEWGVAALLQPREPEEAFHASLERGRAADLTYPVLNGFLPGDLKVTGPEVDASALQAYVETTMDRAERAGVQVIVFGSGSARNIPAGFDGGAAHEQLVTFCRMTGKAARDHGVTVAVEPLNRHDCNVLNTVAESAALVREVDHPAVRLLVDAYHMMRDDDPFDDIVAHGDLLAHVHIATVPHRLPPGGEPCGLDAFFAALGAAAYAGRVSIEGKIADPQTELPAALAVMRKLAGMEAPK